MVVYGLVGQLDGTGGRVVDVSSNGLPERWSKRLIEKGYTDPRFKEPMPSMSALGDKIGKHPSTISNAIQGKTEPDVETINALVNELGKDVAGWLGVKHFGPWAVPESATLLTPRQRKALEELIVSITSREEGSEHGKRSAKKSGDEVVPTVHVLEVEELEVDPEVKPRRGRSDGS